jgi:uncharacterized damage-inducible protein DinB
MEVKEYLLNTFRYNDKANKQILDAVHRLQDQTQAIKFFSHMINSQRKWMARILHHPNNAELSWWDPVYPLEKLEQEWNDSLNTWLRFLEGKNDEEIRREVQFIGYDGTQFAAKLQDIALQLNYHSIHHRAQIQLLIRNQGMDAPFVDYIGTVYRRVQ